MNLNAHYTKNAPDLSLLSKEKSRLPFFGEILMAYIPPKHRKYNLLPMCQARGGEVFSYPNSDTIDKLLPQGDSLIPCGYKNYDEYDAYIDQLISNFGMKDGIRNDLGYLLEEYQKQIHHMNIKENWSILRYIGDDSPGIFGLTKGRYYYWPCSAESPKYEGVIDDEEYTSYLYSTSPELWELAEDPLNMALPVLLGASKRSISIERMAAINRQLKKFAKDDSL